MDTKTIDTITEKGRFLLIGALPLYVRPLTLSQVIEIGEITSNMSELDADFDLSNIYKSIFDNTVETECVQEVALIALFRSRMIRKLLGWYVKSVMSTKTLKKCMEVIHETFDFAFFFETSIFLRGMRQITRGKKEEIHHGESSEE